MDEQPKHTPGPFEIRPVMGEHDVEVYSSATGEPLATVHAPSWSHKDAPDHETALHNAALLKAAPKLRGALETILGSKQEQIRSTTADEVRALLAEIDAGPSETFFKERDEQRREYEEVLQAQIAEMALQTDGRPDNRQEDEREEEDEEHGLSFSF